MQCKCLLYFTTFTKKIIVWKFLSGKKMCIQFTQLLRNSCLKLSLSSLKIFQWNKINKAFTHAKDNSRKRFHGQFGAKMCLQNYDTERRCVVVICARVAHSKKICIAYAIFFQMWTNFVFQVESRIVIYW